MCGVASDQARASLIDALLPIATDALHCTVVCSPMHAFAPAPPPPACAALHLALIIIIVGRARPRPEPGAPAYCRSRA